jgi:hypothetical protein
MLEFETYRFSRLYRSQKLEFYFIQGVNDQDNFDEYWDGRFLKVIGYVLMYQNDDKTTENYIYVINKTDGDYKRIIRYAKQFINSMSLSGNPFESENCKILKTDIKGNLVRQPYEDFIKRIIENEIQYFS